MSKQANGDYSPAKLVPLKQPENSQRSVPSAYLPFQAACFLYFGLCPWNWLLQKVLLILKAFVYTEPGMHSWRVCIVGVCIWEGSEGNLDP